MENGRLLARAQDSPLGARTRTLGGFPIRNHGANEPYTVGQAISPGRSPWIHDGVVDLYNRLKVGTHRAGPLIQVRRINVQ
jgi:hypothetical protein